MASGVFEEGIPEYTDTMQQEDEKACAEEITDLVLQGKWPAFWDERHDDLTWIVQKCLQQRSDADVALGVLDTELRIIAKVYAEDYVDNCDDIEDLAIDLKIREPYEP